MKFKELFDLSHNCLFDLYDLNENFITANYYNAEECNENGNDPDFKHYMNYDVVRVEVKVRVVDTEPNPEDNIITSLAVQLKVIRLVGGAERRPETKDDSDLKTQLDRAKGEISDLQRAVGELDIKCMNYKACADNANNELFKRSEQIDDLKAEIIRLKAENYDLLKAKGV